MTDLISQLAEVACGWQSAMLRVCRERDDLKALLEEAIDLLDDCDAGTQGHEFIVNARAKLLPTKG